MRSHRCAPRAFCVEYLLDRIEFVLRTGIQWSNLPVEGGSWKTVYHHFAKWSQVFTSHDRSHH